MTTPRHLLDLAADLQRFKDSPLYEEFENELTRLRSLEGCNSLYTGDKKLLSPSSPPLEYLLGVTHGLHCATLVFENIESRVKKQIRSAAQGDDRAT